MRFAHATIATGPRLHYAEQGDPDGEAVVFLHGWPDSWFSFSRVAESLPQGYRAMLIDQRGFGDSERPDGGYDIRSMAADVPAFLDALSIERATIVGHSFGSFVARRVALDYATRVERLVLIGSGWVGSNEVTRIVTESLKLPSGLWAELLGSVIQYDDVKELQGMTVPTMLLWGDKDALFSRDDQDRLAAAIPAARLQIYSDTGHCPNWERPGRGCCRTLGVHGGRLNLPAAFLVAFALLCQGWSESAVLHAQGSANETVPVELSTIGIDGRTGTPIVILRDPESGGVLPVWIGVAEAQAIALVLHGVVPPRPMTHDLMASLIGELSAQVEEVVVTDLRNNTYFGMVRLRVEGERKIREVDSRPSDALALALRTGAPIRVVRRILAMAPEFEFIAPEGPNQVVQALGMTVVIATPSLRKEFRLGDQRGVVVTSAFGGARDKGVRRGDLIIEVNGKAIVEPAAFFEAVRAVPPRGKVRITYRRDNKTQTIEIPADVPPAKLGKGGRVVA